MKRATADIGHTGFAHGVALRAARAVAHDAREAMGRVVYCAHRQPLSIRPGS